eukprot:symbB.v1.2.010182.t1/scaffold664.1/size175145/2
MDKSIWVGRDKDLLQPRKTPLISKLETETPPVEVVLETPEKHPLPEKVLNSVPDRWNLSCQHSLPAITASVAQTALVMGRVFLAA